MRLLERQTERETERERGGLSGPSELFHVPAIPASRFFYRSVRNTSRRTNSKGQ